MEAAFNTLYKPIFFQEVPPLQNIVMCKIIQKSWHDELFFQKLDGELDTFLSKCSFVHVALDLRYRSMKLFWNIPWEETQMCEYIFNQTVSLSEQTKIQRSMELYAWNLTREFSIWMRFHGYKVLRDAHSCFLTVVQLLYYFDEFVYDIYGRIDCEKTAKNLLTCIKLTPYQKFTIACLYCFEEEIEQLWPSVQTQMRHDDFAADDDKLVQYWVIRMINQPNTVVLQYNSSTMFAQNSQTYSAMKYFWKNVTSFDEKVNCIGLCFECNNTLAIMQCINYWFPKTGDEILKCVILRYGVPIMIQLIQTFICRKFLLCFWKHTGDMFDGNQFIHILEQMNAKKFRDFRLICRVLWRDAPAKLKAFTLNYYQMEDSFDPLNNLMKRIYEKNPYSIDKKGILIIPSDCIYYPYGCECENYPEKEECKCKTLLS